MSRQNCRTCKFWLDKKAIAYSLCTMAEGVPLPVADVLLREDDSEVAQEYIEEAQQAAPMIYFNTLDDPYLKYVSVATRADFSCSEWGRRTYE